MIFDREELLSPHLDAEQVLIMFFLKSCFLWQRFAWKPVPDIHFEQIHSRLRCNVRFPYLSVSFIPPDCWLEGKQKWVN